MPSKGTVLRSRHIGETGAGEGNKQGAPLEEKYWEWITDLTGHCKSFTFTVTEMVLRKGNKLHFTGPGYENTDQKRAQLWTRIKLFS